MVFLMLLELLIPFIRNRGLPVPGTAALFAGKLSDWDCEWIPRRQNCIAPICVKWASFLGTISCIFVMGCFLLLSNKLWLY